MSENRLPQFIVAGAQKAGSTWLAEMLGNHPALFVPGHELHFFDLDKNYRQGAGWYGDQFAGAADGQVCGEKTPDYLLVHKQDGTRLDTARRIRELLPEVKLLFVLRDPVTRAISALRHHLWFRRLPISVDPGELLFGEQRELCERWNILSNGLYCRQLEEYSRIFPPEQLRVWIFEDDVRARPLEMIREAAGFIGVSQADASIDPGRVSNRGIQSRIALRGNYYLPFLSHGWQMLDRLLGQKFDVGEDCRQQLVEFYRDDVSRLKVLLNRDLALWLPAK